MKSTYLTRVASAALLFGLATAYAQAPTTAPAPSARPMPTSTTPDTTGNDLVSGDNRTDRETGTHPAWKTMDIHKSGYLTAEDVKSHQWLSKNFARCDSNHDGHLTETEYGSCSERTIRPVLK
jgi:hypothetical protein